MDTCPPSTRRAPGGKSSACCLQVQQSTAVYCLTYALGGEEVHMGVGLASLKGSAQDTCKHWALAMTFLVLEVGDGVGRTLPQAIALQCT